MKAKIEEKIEWFLQSNGILARLFRTILQGIIGTLIANVDLLFENFTINSTLKPMIVALVMCVLSPIMKELGRHKNEEGEME